MSRRQRRSNQLKRYLQLLKVKQKWLVLRKKGTHQEVSVHRHKDQEIKKVKRILEIVIQMMFNKSQSKVIKRRLYQICQSQPKRLKKSWKRIKMSRIFRRTVLKNYFLKIIRDRTSCQLCRPRIIPFATVLHHQTSKKVVKLLQRIRRAGNSSSR